MAEPFELDRHQGVQLDLVPLEKVHDCGLESVGTCPVLSLAHKLVDGLQLRWCELDSHKLKSHVRAPLCHREAWREYRRCWRGGMPGSPCFPGIRLQRRSPCWAGTGPARRQGLQLPKYSSSLLASNRTSVR